MTKRDKAAMRDQSHMAPPSLGCHYDPLTGRYSECDGHHHCLCPDDDTVTSPRPAYRRMLDEQRERRDEAMSRYSPPPVSGGVVVWAVGAFVVAILAAMVWVVV